MMGAISLDDQIADGKAVLTGNAAVLDQLKSMLAHFEVGFEILPGTLPMPVEQPDLGTFEQEPLADSTGG